ncbi:putative acetyltransferase [Kineococcus radiotolerans]|uniref:Putative acetyltransferase n=1 Tax=Kineococcus radiotolerans TaxID=131568 RepID=A0A7W4TPY6_KINRA|nr:GNAT family N-acetyltransferase [Kineococcus radiotolerans]MBB2902889.1 putative acetyltransferase [Kineococcus radiotolerans]
MDAALPMTSIDPRDRVALRDWATAGRAAFLQPAPTEEALDERLAEVADHRLTAVRDVVGGEERVVATLRTFDAEVAVPGAEPVVVDAVSTATVLPTHRRRGLLSRMLTADLERARDGGLALAALIAAEAPIYGRFGFGTATRSTSLVVDHTHVRFRPDAPSAPGSLEFVPAGRTEDLARVHDRARRARPGGFPRDAAWWAAAGRRGEGRWLGTRGHVVLHRDEAGVPDGYVAYDLADTSTGRVAGGTATVADLSATTPAAYRALWEFVTSIDLVRSTRAADRPVDELLPHLLVDPRAVQTGPVDDFLWLRVLDVVGALSARRYLGAGTLVLEVVDPFGLAGATVRLHVAPGERGDGEGWLSPEVSTTGAAPDVVLGVGELASLLLGGTSAVALHRAGRLRCSPADAHALHRLFATPEAPWCPTWF